jgi:hypothetical protein
MNKIIEILGHSFVDNAGEDIAVCSRCKMLTFIEGYTELYCYDLGINRWYKLNITCDEAIIKNIIE